MFRRQAELGLGVAEPVFTSTEVSRLAGITLRQLQWWDERKVVSPAKEDHRRLYRTQQVLEVLTISILRHKGLPLQRIRRVLRRLRRHLAQPALQAAAPGFRLWLLTDGVSIHLDEQPERILAQLAGARGAMYLVCLSDQIGLIASAKAPRPRPARQLSLF
jgi:DNA-binding transcriptional MerR regulator